MNIKWLAVGLTFCFWGVPIWAGAQTDATVREGWGTITVFASAPVPAEVTNQTQARAIAREAAIVLGQTHLLNHILQKRTRSGKTLEEAEIPYIKVQGKIRALVKGVIVRSTTWDDARCRVVLVMKKGPLKTVLKSN